MKNKELLYGSNVKTFATKSLAFLVIAFLTLISGCGVQNGEVSTGQSKSSSTEVVNGANSNAQAVTKTPSMTPSPTAVPTSTPGPTATREPTPQATATLVMRELSFNEFRTLILNVLPLLDSCWSMFDGEYIVFDDYIGCPYSPDGSYQTMLNQFREEYEKNNNANFWCKWAWEGYYNSNFGWFPFSSTRAEQWKSLNLVLGTKGVEPYCEEFNGDVVPTWEHFAYSDVTFDALEEVEESDLSLNWTREERQYVIDNYFLKLSKKLAEVNPGLDYIPVGDVWYPHRHGRTDWKASELEKLSDVTIMWAVMNHSMRGLETWISGSNIHYSPKTEYAAKVRVLTMLNEELADYHPDPLSFVSPEFFPNLQEVFVERTQ